MDRNQQLSRLLEIIPVWPANPQAANTFTSVNFLWGNARAHSDGSPPTACRLNTDTFEFQPIEFIREEIFPSVVTEKDFRLPEFRDANPEDFEFDKGRPVRKDRFVKGFEKLYDLLGLGGDLRDIETVCNHVADLLQTEDAFSKVNQLIALGVNQSLVSEVQNLVSLRNAILRNEVVSAEVMERYICLSNTSLLNGWSLEDFAERKWTIIQMVSAGHAFFKTGAGVPALHYPITPPVRAVPEPAPMAFR